MSDITYIPTWAGFLYLAVVLDAFSRRIVGWSMTTTLATQRVLDALNLVLATRPPRGVIHHSDQGSQYASIEFSRRCRDAGVRSLMGWSMMRMTRPCVKATTRKIDRSLAIVVETAQNSNPACEIKSENFRRLDGRVSAVRGNILPLLNQSVTMR